MNQTSPSVSPFVSTEWLAHHLNDPAVQAIDASWYLPAQQRDAAQEFVDGHIPGAVFFDIDAIADRSTELPHMLLDETSFGERVGALGVASASTLVVYDGMGLFSAPRVWWMFRHFGAGDVRVLDGGLPKWRTEARPLEKGPAQRPAARFHTRTPAEAVADVQRVQRALQSGAAQVIDVRTAGRFRGEVPEPRPGVRAGHIPGSVNLPFTELLANGSLRQPGELRDLLAAAGVHLDTPIIASCGSGVTAAILLLAAEVLGRPGMLLYDGSWSEWGSRPDLPVATGP